MKVKANTRDTITAVGGAIGFAIPVAIVRLLHHEPVFDAAWWGAGGWFFGWKARHKAARP